MDFMSAIDFCLFFIATSSGLLLDTTMHWLVESSGFQTREFKH